MLKELQQNTATRTNPEASLLPGARMCGRDIRIVQSFFLQCAINATKTFSLLLKILRSKTDNAQNASHSFAPSRRCFLH